VMRHQPIRRRQAAVASTARRHHPTRSLNVNSSSQAARRYSWINPPSTSTRSTDDPPANGSTACSRRTGAGGCRSRPRCGRAVLQCVRYSISTRSSCCRFQINVQSRHSLRTVRTHRSAYAFARGARGGIFTASIPAAANTASNAEVNLVSRVANQEPELVHPLVEVHQQVAGLLSHLCPGRLGGDPGQVDPPSLHLDNEHHIQPGQGNGLDREEVAGQKPAGLGA
jgi:hypothetical protein